MISSWIKNIIERVFLYSSKYRRDDYRASYLRNQEVMMHVTLERDKALMTFSIAALAAIAALNDKIFQSHGWLSLVTLICFIVVVVSVILGYSFSKGMLVDAQKIISKNFKNAITAPLGQGLEKVKYNKASKISNIISTAFFIIGMILFIVLLALYIGGINL